MKTLNITPADLTRTAGIITAHQRCMGTEHLRMVLDSRRVSHHFELAAARKACVAVLIVPRVGGPRIEGWAGEGCIALSAAREGTGNDLGALAALWWEKAEAALNEEEARNADPAKRLAYDLGNIDWTARYSDDVRYGNGMDRRIAAVVKLARTLPADTARSVWNTATANKTEAYPCPV